MTSTPKVKPRRIRSGGHHFDTAYPEIPESHIYEALFEGLRRRGVRLTAPRQAILAALAGAQHPLSVPELYGNVLSATKQQRDKAHPNAPRINVVTVYRLVHLLAEAGLVHRMRLSDDHYRYTPSGLCRGETDYSYHLICKRCGKITITACGSNTLASLVTRQEKESGYRIAQLQMEMFGVCSACQEEQEV